MADAVDLGPEFYVVTNVHWANYDHFSFAAGTGEYVDTTPSTDKPEGLYVIFSFGNPGDDVGSGVTPAENAHAIGGTDGYPPMSGDDGYYRIGNRVLDDDAGEWPLDQGECTFYLTGSGDGKRNLEISVPKPQKFGSGIHITVTGGLTLELDTTDSNCLEKDSGPEDSWGAFHWTDIGDIHLTAGTTYKVQYEKHT